MILIPAKYNIVSSRGLLIPFEGKYEFMVAEDAFYKPAQRSLRRQGHHAFGLSFTRWGTGKIFLIKNLHHPFSITMQVSCINFYVL